MPNIEWKISHNPVAYDDAIAFMENRISQIHDNLANETIWFLEHSNIYTIGTSGKETDIIDANGIEIVKTGRGGKITYHGPGQRIIYIMLDLRKRGRDIKCFVQNVEKWVILALNELGIKGEIRDGRVGVWVDNLQPNGTIFEEKIAAIGIRIRRFISFHGIAINFDPKLEYFDGIVPCGISKDEHGVTSIKKLKPATTMADLDEALKKTFALVFKN